MDPLADEYDYLIWSFNQDYLQKGMEIAIDRVLAGPLDICGGQRGMYRYKLMSERGRYMFLLQQWQHPFAITGVGFCRVEQDEADAQYLNILEFEIFREHRRQGFGGGFLDALRRKLTPAGSGKCLRPVNVLPRAAQFWFATCDWEDDALCVSDLDQVHEYLVQECDWGIAAADVFVKLMQADRCEGTSDDSE